MDENLISPLELKVTFVHNDNEKVRGTFQYLDSLYKKGDLEKLRHLDKNFLKLRKDGNFLFCETMHKEDLITAVKDPDNGDLFVYDGNKRVRHAVSNNYEVMVRIIINQTDLDSYLKDFEIKWFGIEDFSELMDLMRSYSQNPREDGTISDDFKAKISKAYYKMRDKKEVELFGDYD
jgi:hypothetical protein